MRLLYVIHEAITRTEWNELRTELQVDVTGVTGVTEVRLKAKPSAQGGGLFDLITLSRPLNL